MKKATIFLIILMLICCRGVPYAFDEEWRLVIDKEGIQVYVRDLPDSPLREYRAETTFNENIFPVLAVLDDVSTGVKWFPLCPFARVIDEQPDGRKTVLSVADLPWPFQDRYVVFSRRNVWDYHQKKVIIDFETDDFSRVRAVDDFLKVDNMIRIPFMKGQWALSLIDRDKTKVEYTISADAGGNIPLWLLRTFFDDTPYKTLDNLRHFIESYEYQEERGPEQGRPDLSVS